MLIMAILTEAPEREWRVADLLDVMTARGWQSSSPWPNTVVRVAASRLESQGVLERVGRGLYRPAAGERP
jgi:predicted transcriptional regulator of viral defense system